MGSKPRRAQTITIWHNPRCSKSRQTLALLQERGVQPVVREYLADPPSRKELEAMLQGLGMEAPDAVRTGEEPYKKLGLGATSPRSAVLNAMAAHPILIQRPVVLRGARAALGRPPENVLKLLD